MPISEKKLKDFEERVESGKSFSKADKQLLLQEIRRYHPAPSRDRTLLRALRQAVAQMVTATSRGGTPEMVQDTIIFVREALDDHAA